MHLAIQPIQRFGQDLKNKMLRLRASYSTVNKIGSGERELTIVIIDFRSFFLLLRLLLLTHLGDTPEGEIPPPPHIFAEQEGI